MLQNISFSVQWFIWINEKLTWPKFPANRKNKVAVRSTLGKHWCCTKGCDALCIQRTCWRRIVLQRRLSWAVGEVACCMLFRPSHWVSGSHPAARTHTHTHSHTHAPTSRWGACSLRRCMIVCSRGGEFYMRAAAGVTAFFSASDFNLWNANFARFSHKNNKKTKKIQRCNMFLLFLCVYFLSSYLVWSNLPWLLMLTVWPAWVALFMAACAVLIKTMCKPNFPSRT